MPATISVSNSSPYSGNLYPVNAPVLNDKTMPAEGPKAVAISFNWTTDAQTPNYAVEVNLVNTFTQQQISQIAGLYVDNSQNGADAYFYFPDTQFRLAVPPNTCGFFPVVTNAKRFIAYCPGANSQSETFVQVLNYVSHTVSSGQVNFVEPVATAIISLASGSTTIYNKGSGVMRGFELSSGFFSGAVAAGCLVQLQDSTGATLWEADFYVPTTPNYTLDLKPPIPPGGIAFVGFLNLVLSYASTSSSGLYVTMFITPQGD